MKTIYLVRHAQALPEKEGMQDIDRPLSEIGIKDAKRVAKRLGKNRQIPEMMITSSAQRAIQTATLKRIYPTHLLAA